MKDEEKTEDEINILDYLIVLAKYKKKIIIATLTVAIITAIYSLTLTKVYLAETRILTPGQSGSGIATQLLRQFGNVGGFADKTIGLNDPIVFISILKSRPVYDKIIDRFGLMERYDAKNRESAWKELGAKLGAAFETAGKQGLLRTSRIIIISAKDKDPEIAADMANAFVEALKSRLQELAVTEASQRRLFFDEQLKQATKELVKSEEAMKEFQEKTGILNPDPLMPAIRIPAVATEYIRKLRELKYNEKLFEIMAKQYEIARIDEAKDAAIIQVIDKAIPPEEKFGPLRRKMVIAATFISFFFSVFLAFFMEYLERAPKISKENKERIETLKKYLSFKRKK